MTTIAPPHRDLGSRPEISVVIPTRNRVELLMRCLASLHSQSLPAERFEVTVVDDGSTDDTAERVEALRRAGGWRLALLRQRQAGPAAARNLGLAASLGEIVAFIDDDCVADRKWLEAALAALGDPRVSGVGGRLLGLPSSTFIGRYSNDLALFELPPRRDGEILYLNTANAAFRRQVLREAGGFDPSFRKPGGEEVDLCRRLRQQGFWLVAHEPMVVHYAYREDLAGLLRTYFVYGRGSRILQRIADRDGGPVVPRRRPLELLVAPLPGLYRQFREYVARWGAWRRAVSYLGLDALRITAYRFGYLAEVASERLRPTTSGARGRNGSHGGAQAERVPLGTDCGEPARKVPGDRRREVP